MRWNSSNLISNRRSLAESKSSASTFFSIIVNVDLGVSIFGLKTAASDFGARLPLPLGALLRVGHGQEEAGPTQDPGLARGAARPLLRIVNHRDTFVVVLLLYTADELDFRSHHVAAQEPENDAAQAGNYARIR